MDRDCDTCKHDDAKGKCTAPTPGDCLPKDGRPLWEEFTAQEPWTACEDCANACGGGDDFLECGLDLGAPYGGGVTFICAEFKPAPSEAEPSPCRAEGEVS
ncbi:MAG: hypothetical protein K2X44_08750 [Magnetospirillum sp.]|nr:hypothetical protein [Magnetospirillum sp.]